MQQLVERTAQFIVKNLRQNLQFPWCQRMLDRVKLPAAVHDLHDHAHFRVWRFYDMNIWSEKKRVTQTCIVGLRLVSHWLERSRTQRTGPLPARRYRLHAPESGEAPPGGEAGRLALVELEILLSGRCVATRHGSDAVIRY